MANEEAPCGQFLMLREFGVSLGHLGHFVQLVEADMGVMRVSTTRENNVDILQSNILYLAVFQSNDAAWGNIAG